MERVFTFYDLEGATALHEALARLRRRPLVVERRRHAHQVPGRAAGVLLPGRLVLPPSAASATRSRSPTSPRSTARSPSRSPPRRWAACWPSKRIELVTEFNTGEVDGERRTARLLRRARGPLRPRVVIVPVHGGRRVRRPLAGPRRRARLRRPPTRTRCSRRLQPNVFAIGDAANLPASKAGSVTPLRGRGAGREHPPLPRRARSSSASFDGHANCFIETGFDKALLIDFNYDQPSRWPVTTPASSGCRCSKESRLNHLGKLMFQWFYWHSLLPGRDIPGIHADMPDSPASTVRLSTTERSPCPPRPSPASTSTSTTRASSSTPSSGPRTWPRASPPRTASTS